MIWKDINNYEGLYAVSNTGEVKSYPKKKGSFHKLETLLTLSVKRNGYLQAALSKDNKVRHVLVHRLVAIHFLPNPDALPQVNHINGIKTDNRSENLEWVTSSDNLKHSYKIGLQRQDGEYHATKKLNWEKVRLIRTLHANGVDTHTLSNQFGVHSGHINSIIANKFWKEKKFEQNGSNTI